MSIKTITLNSLTMYQGGAQIKSGLPTKIVLNITMTTDTMDDFYGKPRPFIQLGLMDSDNNKITIKSGGTFYNHNNESTSGWWNEGTVTKYNNTQVNLFGPDTPASVTANFTITGLDKTILEKITTGFTFNDETNINQYLSSLSNTDGTATYAYSNFYIEAFVRNNSVTRGKKGEIKKIPSGYSIFVPNTPMQFTAPEDVRIAIKDSLNLQASNNSSSLIYSPVRQNYIITGYRERTDCLVGTCLERVNGKNIKIKWKNNSRIIFSKTFYDYLTILRKPGASITIDGKSYYISHPFPLTKLRISLTCVKDSSKDYKKTITINQTDLTWDSTNQNYYYSLTGSTIFNYTAINDDADYLTEQGQTLRFDVDIDLLDINGMPDTWSSYWGNGILNLVITNPDVPTKIHYYGTTESSLSMSKETADNNILYCDQKANSYIINIPATETTESYIIYNYKISFYIKSINKKIELWRGYGLPDSKNTSSLPTAMQSSNANNKIKSNNLFSVSFTKEALNNKIFTALGSQSHYNGLSGDELWEGYFIIESVLGNDYNIIDNDSDIKVTTSKQIGSLLLSNNYTKIDGNALKLTVTKHKLENNIKRETEVEYVFNQSKESIQNAQGNAVGYVNSDETATFKQFAFLHYKDVTYTNLKLTIQDLSYNDALTSRKWELNFNNSSNLIRGLNNNTTQVTGSNGLTYSRYSYNINQSYLSNSGYNSSFYYVIAGSIFTVEVTFTYRNKTYSETHSTKRYRKIVFCNVDRNRFNSVVELKQYIAKNDSKNSIEVQFSEDFLDIGGALSYNQLEPYNSWYQNFYFNGNNGKIERVITAYYKEDDVWKSLRIGDSNLTAKSENAFEFDKIMTAIPSSPKPHTITIHKDTSEKIFGEVKILITYYLRDGAYYPEYATGSTISNGIQAKSREIYFNTASPTIYKRPFSVGIDQIPGDEEVLRIDIPDADSSKKYIALGDNLLIDLTDGSFYIYAGSSATKPGAGTIYLTATIPEQDYNTDETKIVINNSIPFREKVGIPEKHKKIYKKYSKKTSF